MTKARQFITERAAGGRYHFATQEALREMGGRPAAVRAALRRLKAKGEIADPYRGFHVIVPPEYRRLGCLPADQFIPQLMGHLGEPYYVALLSAAELHGAAHQRPQSFQVMVKRNRRPVQCGDVRVEFVARRDLERTSTVEKNTPRGVLRVSSPEETALELVGYADHSGGLDNVAEVLPELADSLDSKKLLDAASRSPVAWSQRLGYLLDATGYQALGDVLAPFVTAHAREPAPLVRARSKTGARRLSRWRLAINERLELDG